MYSNLSSISFSYAVLAPQGELFPEGEAASCCPSYAALPSYARAAVRRKQLPPESKEMEATFPPVAKLALAAQLFPSCAREEKLFHSLRERRARLNNLKE